MTRSSDAGRLRFFIPIVADYAQLEPVILRALVKRAAQPFEVPGIGPVTARFDKVTAYGTTSGRIAVGLAPPPRPVSGDIGEHLGGIWPAARPVNSHGSAQVHSPPLVYTRTTSPRRAH